MKVLLVHPGAEWSTADVEAGLRYGLKSHGVEVIPYRLDQRIVFSHKWLHIMWRQKRKDDPTLAKPEPVDTMYHAGTGAIEMALRHQVDVVLIVSAMFLHPDVLIMMKRAGLRVTILFTESPYDHDKELRVAGLTDPETGLPCVAGCWTNERSVLGDFKAVNRCAGYLPHAWHPERHYHADIEGATTPSHDVVFVGSGFPERIAWFNAIDWTGIDLGLYGNWKSLGLSKALRPYVKSGPVSNELASDLYRRAKIGLNLYRTFAGEGKQIAYAESLSPRAYELAACGAFHLSERRAEVQEIFGDLVPTFDTPMEAESLIRQWLTDPDGRDRVARQLPACVAEMSWHQRAMTVIGDLQGLLEKPRAA